MKGKNIFTKQEFEELKSLIRQRLNADKSNQKQIRNKMRAIGFFGRDDFGIVDCHISDLESLVRSGIIKVIGNKVEQNIVSKHKPAYNIENQAIKFNKIDPKHQDLNSLTNLNGIYIFTLRNGCDFPDTHNKPEYKLYEGQRVLYIGQTKSGLNSRINKKHFNGKAGSSTLRKSIGCLLGFKLIPRSNNNPNDGKTTFEKCDEIKLSQWMKDNLIVYYAIVLDDIDSAENKFINSYSPPLNLSKVPLDKNQGFRSELSSLRSMK